MKNWGMPPHAPSKLLLNPALNFVKFVTIIQLQYDII